LRDVLVRYDGPSGVLMSSDEAGPVEFHQGEVTATTRKHLELLARVLPDHVLVEVPAEKAEPKLAGGSLKGSGPADDEE
jgi:hypothetical protein